MLLYAPEADCGTEAAPADTPAQPAPETQETVSPTSSNLGRLGVASCGAVLVLGLLGLGGYYEK